MSSDDELDELEARELARMGGAFKGRVAAAAKRPAKTCDGCGTHQSQKWTNVGIDWLCEDCNVKRLAKIAETNATANISFGEDEDEVVARELKRLGRAQARAPTTVSSFDNSASSAAGSTTKKEKATLDKKISNLSLAAQEKVKQAQAALGGSSGQPVRVTIPKTKEQLAVFEDPTDPCKVRVCSFFIEKEGSNDRVSLESTQSEYSVVVVTTPSKHDTTATLFIEGKKLMVETEHTEESFEDGAKVTETVGNIHGITFPYQLALERLELRPLAGGRMAITILKPTFD